MTKKYLLLLCLVCLLLPLAAKDDRLKRFKKHFKDDFPLERIAAIEDLGEPRTDKEAEAVFDAGFTDKELLVRLYAIKFFSAGSPEIVRPHLEKGLKHRDATVRYCCLKSLADLNDKEMLPQIRDALTDGNWRVRAQAALCLASLKDPEATAAVLPLIKDDEYKVRIAAIDALAMIQSPEAIKPLIELCGSEENWRVQSALLDAFMIYKDKKVVPAIRDLNKRVSGVMKDRGKLALNSVLNSENEELAHDFVTTFYGIQSQSQRIIFVIDCSESMASEIDEDEFEKKLASGVEENILGLVQTQLIETLKKMDSKEGYFNVVFVRDEADIWKKELQQASSSNIKKAVKAIKRQQPTGRTNIYQGLAAAMRFENTGDFEEGKRNLSADTIYLLSDGQANAGTYKNSTAITTAIKEVNRYARMTIHTIAINRANKLMEDLASLTGGSTGTIKRSKNDEEKKPADNEEGDS